MLPIVVLEKRVLNRSKKFGNKCLLSDFTQDLCACFLVFSLNSFLEFNFIFMSEGISVFMRTVLPSAFIIS